MINALIRNKDETAIVECPLDSFKMILQLRSIGIYENPRNIKLTDNEKDDIHIRLYAENDLGSHVMRLFSEKHTLEDVNILCMVLQNAREEIRDALEQDILYDQYCIPQELISDIRERTAACGIVKLSFFCPLDGNIEDSEYGDQHWVGNEFLRCNEWAIRELLEMEQFSPEDEMAQFFDDDDNVKAKLVSAVWTVDEYKGKLYGRINCSFTEKLTEDEMKTFRDWLLGQCSDGFGEHFEQQPIQTEEGDIFVSFWHSDNNYFLCTEDELDACIKNSQGLQMGGM